LVTIDDAQWVDQASLEALTFAGNRLEVEGIALMFAVRSGQPVAQRLSRFRTLALTGLDISAARALSHGRSFKACRRPRCLGSSKNPEATRLPC